MKVDLFTKKEANHSFHLNESRSFWPQLQHTYLSIHTCFSF